MALLTINTDKYNNKRYGKPYIGLCGADGKVTQWGDWLGTIGCAGELSLNIPDTPTLVMRGQKDNRVTKNSAPYYGVFVAGKHADADWTWTSDKLKSIRLLRELTAG